MLGANTEKLGLLNRLRPPAPTMGDLIAGVSVVLVLIPQALAYAELAGMPSHLGLLAGAFPAVVAAIIVSSPYLQTGPTALTALLVFGALQPLAETGSPEYVKLGALLALVVGVARVAMGLMRLGGVAYFLSQPVLTGFTTGAAFLICGSQVPKILGVDGDGGSVLGRAFDVAMRVEEWNWASISVGCLAIVLIFGLRRIHPLFPSALVAVGATWITSAVLDLDVPQVGAISGSIYHFETDFPFDRLGDIIIPGLIIALIGFAEPAAISRTYAAERRERWSANQEFVSQGAANLASAFSGAFPVGGSFGRSSLNVAAGAQTRWSGFVTGALIIIGLPLANKLETMPTAALSAVVVTAALKLIRFDRIKSMWVWSRPQAFSAAATLMATLALDPRIDRAIILGIGISIGIHLWRELNVYVDVETLFVKNAEDPEGKDTQVLHITPHGVLWFGSITKLSEQILDTIAHHPTIDDVQINLQGIGRLDLTAAGELAQISVDARRNGAIVTFQGIPPHAVRLFRLIIDPS